ncbi:hypothetical protein BP6252_03421 [Coleophoma cylindrospora]|uniref:Uncharacterized protein n=1 Tax=Coleophoma cylindrospora TaxID=1849047 RepID=A0A3D8S7M8_9HELO|nr:hypothetical protein BP6252_03421 [Coleophoma cylindrospora]
MPSAALSISLTPGCTPKPSLLVRLTQSMDEPGAQKVITPHNSLSFCFKHNDQEVFLEDRIVYRDLEKDDQDGSFLVRLDNVPLFRDQVMNQEGVKKELSMGEMGTEVAMHIWKGERYIGEWDVGRF